jgi:hypothetical protein
VLHVDGEQLLQRALGAGIQRVADCGDVTLRVAVVLLVLVGRRVVDAPELLNPVVLIFLIFIPFYDQRVELQRVLIRVRVLVIRPIFLWVGECVARPGLKFFFFESGLAEEDLRPFLGASTAI